MYGCNNFTVLATRKIFPMAKTLQMNFLNSKIPGLQYTIPHWVSHKLIVHFTGTLIQISLLHTPIISVKQVISHNKDKSNIINKEGLTILYLINIHSITKVYKWKFWTLNGNEHNSEWITDTNSIFKVSIYQLYLTKSINYQNWPWPSLLIRLLMSSAYAAISHE